MTSAGTPDVLSQGSDGERRQLRPSRPDRVVAAAAALVLLAGLGGARWVRHERALDRAAAARVALFLGGLVEDPTVAAQPSYGLHLSNDGPQRVTVVGVRFDAPGYPLTPVSVEVPAHVLVDVEVPSTTCAHARYDTWPQRVEVVVRTARGATVRRRLPLGVDVQREVELGERERCGLEKPIEALVLDVLDARLDGRSVSVRLQAANTSRLPLTVEAFQPLPGLRAHARLPLRLAPHQQTPVLLRLDVPDCAALERSAVELQGSHEAAELYVAVRNPYDEGVADVWLGGNLAAGVRRQSPVDLVRRLCPAAVHVHG